MNAKLLSTFTILIIIAATSFGQRGQEDMAKSRQTAEKMSRKVSETYKLNCLLLLPQDYKEKKKERWPLMLFLHGIGERGSDVNKVKVHGPPKVVEKRKDFPFIVVSPQCPADSWWRPFELLSLLDEIQKDYRVDPDRVYLTGLSM